MKTYLLKGLMTLALSLSFSLLFAQRDSLPADKMAYRLKNQLNLNEDQTLKIRDIYKEQGRKMKETRQSEADPKTKREAQRKHMQEADTQVKALLSPEQQKEYDLIKEKMREERKEHQGQRKQAKRKG